MSNIPAVQPVAAPPAAPAKAKTSGLAIASLVLGIAGPCTVGLGSIIGLILGIVGLVKIGRSAGAKGGRGLAIAGIVVSGLGIVILPFLAILAAILMPAVYSAKDKVQQARIATTRVDIANIEVAIDAFEVDCGRFPSTEEGLRALLDQPSVATGWKGPYLKRGTPKDPWANLYLYRCPGQHNPNRYDLYSFGLDGLEGTEDDIGNWSEVP